MVSYLRKSVMMPNLPNDDLNCDLNSVNGEEYDEETIPLTSTSLLVHVGRHLLRAQR